MATELSNAVPNRQGLDASGVAVSEKLHVNPAEGPKGYLAANQIAACEGKAMVVGWGGYVPYVSGKFTETKDNSSTIAYTGAGLRFQTNVSPTDNDDTCVTSLETQLLAAGKVYKWTMDITISSVANFGFTVGFVTSGSTELFTADPADGVFLTKAKNAATVVLRVIENSGTPANSATIATMVDATKVKFSVEFMCGASAALSWGNVYVDGVRTAFTSSQLTGLFNMVTTTAPTLAFQVGTRVNGTTTRNAVMSYCLGEVDR